MSTAGTLLVSLAAAAAAIAALLALRMRARTTAAEVRCERLEAMLRLSPVGLFQNEADGSVGWINPRGTELSGVRAGDTREQWSQVIHPEDRDEFLVRWTEATEAGAGYTATMRVRGDEGTFRRLTVQAHPVHEPTGALSGWLGVLVDLSSVQVAEDRAAHLAAIVDSSTDAIYRRTTDGTITAWNAGAETLLGWRADEIIGRSVLELMVPEHRATPLTDLGSTTAPDRPVQESELLHKSGQRVQVAATATPITLPSGEQVGVAAILRDVSQERAATVALQAYAAELERSNAELEDYAYIASHDLSEPLHVVGGYASLLETRYPPGSVVDERAGQIVTTISEAVDRMRQLIDDLLSYSRLRRSDLALDSVALDAVLTGVRADLASAISAADATLEVGPLPVVHGDKGMLGQLFSNLVANAVKFRAPGRRCVVRVSSTSADRMLRIAVTDNGIGIDPAYHERIFAMFRRLQPQDEYDGTGIGLTVCRRVADLHGGRVEVTSVPDEGTTFVVTLPRPPQAVA